MYNPYDKMAAFKNRKIARLRGLGNTDTNLPQVINAQQNKAEGRMTRSGVPSSILLDTNKEREMQGSAQINAIMNPRRQEQKMMLLDEQEQLNTIETKREAFDAEQKRIKDEKKKARDKMLTKLGFTAVGAALAPFTGGASLPIASGLGDMAAGSGVGTGDFLGEETIDEGLIAQGFANTVMGVMSAAKTNAQRTVATAYSDNSDKIMSLSPDGLQQLRTAIDTQTAVGNFKEAANLINTFDYDQFMWDSNYTPGQGYEL